MIEFEIPADRGEPYTLERRGALIALSRRHPGGRAVILCDAEAAFRIADALVDAAERVLSKQNQTPEGEPLEA